MGFLSFSRPRGNSNNNSTSNKKARVSSPPLTTTRTRTSRPSSCFIPSVVDDWLDDLPHKLCASRRLQPLFRRDSAATKPTKHTPRTLPGTHPVGTPRTKMTGRRAVSTVSDSPSSLASSSYALPPGAAAPTLGHILDYSLDNKDYFSRPSVEFDFDLELSAAEARDETSESSRRRRSRLRTQSFALDNTTTGSYASGNYRRPYSTTTQIMATAPPAVPPRSALRGSSTPSTTSLSQSSTAPSSSSSSSLVPDAMEQRPYVLAVEPPTANFDEHVTFTAATPKDAKKHESTGDEVILFRKQAARRRSIERLGLGHPKHSSGVIDERDPFKVRDHKPVRNSSSGVYTPATFPGPSASPTLSFPNSPTTPTSPGHFASSQMTVRTPNSAPSGYSAYPGGIYANGVCARAMSSFKRLSMAVNAPASAPLPPIGRPMSAMQYPTSGMVYTPPSMSARSSMSHATTTSSSSHHSRTGTSPPSSAHSVSPPVTPTTPSSYVTRNGVVLIEADHPEYAPPVSPLGLDGAEPTPKQSPSQAMRGLEIKTVSIPVAERTVTPLSPTAPKRARRKPVPRLEDDDLVKRLEAVEV